MQKNRVFFLGKLFDRAVPYLIISAIICGPLMGAHAQTACPAATQGTSPWKICTTWAGPTWVQYYDTTKPPAVTPLSELDLNVDGFADINWKQQIAINTLTNGTHSFVLAPTAPIAGYIGNFDGSGRMSIIGPNASGQMEMTTYIPGAGYSNPVVITWPSIGSMPDIKSIIRNTNQFQTNMISPHHMSATESGAVVTIGDLTVNSPLIMDVNGAGADDIVLGYYSTTTNGYQAPSQQWTVYSYAGNGVFTSKTWLGPAGGYTTTASCVTGDFNGDGLKDLACNSSDLANGGLTSNWTILLSTGTGWASQTWAGPTANMVQPCGTETLNGSGVYTQQTSCTNQCLVGDFDGDGISDIACATNPGQIMIGFGGGVNGFKRTVTWSVPNNTMGAPISPLTCKVTDIYGTGRDGFLCWGSSSQTSQNFIYWASTGQGLQISQFSTNWTLEVPSSNGGTWGLPTNPNNICTFGDFDGDGILDIACNVSQNGTWLMALSGGPTVTSTSVNAAKAAVMKHMMQLPKK